MGSSLFRQDMLPFLGYFALLFAATTLGDFVLHQFDLVWIGRYLGIPGTLLILLAMLYSLRKRGVIGWGTPRSILAMHVFCTSLGAFLVLVHAGIHFTTILPWLALVAMIVNVISGVVGRHLLARSRRRLTAMQERYRLHGASQIETERQLFWDAVTFEIMGKWHSVHLPISIAFGMLAMGHIVSIFLFWAWR